MKFYFEFRSFAKISPGKKVCSSSCPWTIEKEPPKKGQSKNKTSLVTSPSHLGDWTSPRYCSLGSASPLKKLYYII
jgi:hypothetical protein